MFGLEKGLPPVRHQAIILIYADILSIGTSRDFERNVNRYTLIII